MNDSQINTILQNYARQHLSPTQEEQEYVQEKYSILKQFLGQSCFRAGSFARFTAVRPIHDLDVIWVTSNQAIMDDPQKLLADLAVFLRKEYVKLQQGIPKITAQSHCVMLEFNDIDGGFSIDVVPAIPSLDPSLKNDFGDPIYIVPEILEYSHTKRVNFYTDNRNENDVSWIYTDPKGYIQVAKNLDESTKGDYRKVAKYAKAWRSNLKAKLEDQWKLKSFNVEQICAEEFVKASNLSVYDGLRTCFAAMSEYILQAPCIKDRAYKQVEEDKYIDEYLADDAKVPREAKLLILQEIEKANQLIIQMSTCKNESELLSVIEKLITGTSNASSSSSTTFSSPPRPWVKS